jgi:hypothetical protein
LNVTFMVGNSVAVDGRLLEIGSVRGRDGKSRVIARVPVVLRFCSAQSCRVW